MPITIRLTTHVSVPVSHGIVALNQHAQYPDIEEAKWNSAVIYFISSTCAFLTDVKMPSVNIMSNLYFHTFNHLYTFIIKL